MQGAGRWFISLILVTFAAVTWGEKPNIVFILADDLGAHDLGCYGNDFNETPNLDRLAKEGVRFYEAYSAAPLCSPTRASIMTGKYPARLGITDWIPGDYRPHMPLEAPVTKQYLEPSEVTIAEALKEGGYATAYIGKWHLGEAPEHLPQAQGFDIAVADDHKPAGYFPPYKLNHLEEGAEGEYLTDRLGAEAAKLIEKLAPAEAPYFLFLGQYAVHAPIVAKPDKLAKYQAKGEGSRDKRSIEYAAMLESLDDSVGVVLDQIEKSGEAKNTIVIFTSDNGGFYQATENYPLRGYKSNLYEGGIRVPLLIRGPIPRNELLVIGDGSMPEPVVSTDFYPTLLEWAGLPLRDEQHVDGVSFYMPMRFYLGATGSRDATSHGTMFWHFPHYQTPARGEPSSAVRAGQFKLLHFYDGDRVELYNLVGDPSEQFNLRRRMPEKTDELLKLLDEKLAEMGAVIPKRNPKQ